MAQQLRAQDQQVALLAMMDAFYPGIARPRLGISRKIRVLARHLRAMSATQRRRYIRDRLGEWGQNFLPSWACHWARGDSRCVPVTADRMREELLHTATSDAIWGAFGAYRARRYDGCVTLICARTQHSLAQDGRAWRRVAARGSKQFYLTCSHSGIVVEPHVRHLAAFLSKCLRQPPQSNR